MRNTFVWFCIALGFAVSWKTSLAEGGADITFEARNVLKTHCARCHSGPGSDGGDFNMLNVDDLMQKEIIKPGNTAESKLLKRIERGEMPPQPASISINEIDIIRRWIHAGAAKFQLEEAKREFIGLDKILQWQLDYLRNINPDDRKYFRFFTLHNVYNDKRVLNKDLRLYRAGLAKVINSLSMKNEIILPEAIEVGANKDLKILYAIDVRNYDWDRVKGWGNIMRAYPYGLGFDSNPNPNLHKLDKEIQNLSDCFIPMIRADWFIATASRPPLYYEMLQIPETAGKLEAAMGLSIKDNYANPTPNRIARAGFHKSGVSAQNRMLERHTTSHGYYWKSYDFKAGSVRSKLTRFPLGPVSLMPAGEAALKNLAFKHDGGEVIYSLPNGLQAYMLVDGEDKRIDAGPIEVVGDSLKTSGNHAIVNGVSCMSCHKHGMLEFKDYVREGNALFGEPLQKVYDLYPEQKVMDQLVAKDKNKFMKALHETMDSYLLIEEDKNAKLEDFPDPVGELSRFYRLGYLDLDTIATELNETKAIELQNKLGVKYIKFFGLKALNEHGGVISRLEWESNDGGSSLMQDVARGLQFTPKSSN